MVVNGARTLLTVLLYAATAGVAHVCSFALYTDDIGLNPYIARYDKVTFDQSHIRHQHERVRRSASTSASASDDHGDVDITLKTHGAELRLHLQRATARTNFYVTKNNNDDSDEAVKRHLTPVLYEGVLADEAHESSVTGAIIDDAFYGTIRSKRRGTFHVESPRRYNRTMSDAHAIVYHEDDIRLDLDKVARLGRGRRRRRSTGLDDDDPEEAAMSCGAARRDIHERMKRQQEAMFDDEEEDEEEEEDFEHRSAQARQHLSVKGEEEEEAIRMDFPNKRTICNLYLRVDPQLHAEVFNNEGNRDLEKTTTFLLFYLNKHVEALNAIYNSVQFYNADKDKYYVGLQFMIYRTKIITDEQCRAYKSGATALLTAEEQKLCEPYLDVSTFLNYVSLDNFTDYCLSYTFTARDFTDGTLGLAWVAKLTGSVGGVCERRQTLQGISKSLNSGIVTVVNYQSRVPEAVSHITFAHEVGHNFGSEHDPDDGICSPGSSNAKAGSGGGNFIMYRRATTGTDLNNRNFSQCSKDQMGPVLHSLVENRNKFCFKQYTGSLCGNGIVEEGEECDCGYGNECKESCCWDASQDSVRKCKLKPNTQCSPSQGACCEHSCTFAPATTVCMHSTECLNTVTCTARNATCPRNDATFFKPDKTECNSGTQVCQSGICSGSICEKYEMQQCYLQGDLNDKKQDKAMLCHLACTGEKTQHMCVDSFNIDEMVNKNTSMGLILKPGSSCLGTHGYCDIFSKCRSVDGEGPLLRLKKFLLSPVTLSSIRLWVTTYWWGALLISVGLVVFMATFVKVCSVHTPSSNPHKPPALRITDTLRRPIKKIPHPHLYHMGHHGHSNGGSSSSHPNAMLGAAAAASSKRTQFTGLAQHTSAGVIVNEKSTRKGGQPTSSSSSSSKATRRGQSNESRATDDSPAASGVKHVFHKNSSSGGKRHKSNDSRHYYNDNHPMHPIVSHNPSNHAAKTRPHKAAKSTSTSSSSSETAAATAAAAAAKSKSSSRSKSADSTNAHASKQAAAQLESTSNEKKKKIVVDSTTIVKSSRPAHKQHKSPHNEHNEQQLAHPQARKQSSTESSSLDVS